MKHTLIVANWKMHLTVGEASLLYRRLHDKIPPHRGVEVVLAPSLVALQPLSLEIDQRRFKLAAQNAYFKDEGAFTGEVSFTMLRGLVHYVIVGHSERRLYFAETNEVVRDKVQAAIRNEITPILCLGENHQQRVSGESNRVIHDQLTSALANLTAAEVSKLVIAYEPVWAISTFGHEVAKPDIVSSAFAQIRHQIKELYGMRAAADVRVLYGGSVDNQSAAAYLNLPDCDGLLVGVASLNYHHFTDIVSSAYRVNHEVKPD